MPDERRRTTWERLWAEPLDTGDAPGAPDAPDGPITVRVMAPVLEVGRAGTAIGLRSMPAKLLLALLVAHPQPLHVEQAVDLLWPEAAPEVGRPRLNTVVHRLRTALGLAPGTLRRVGDVLLLDPAGWDVDLLRFRAAPAEVVAEVTGNLCHVQFPYDDLLVEQRHVLDAQIASARRGDA
jgi:DNA-binding SARP family transcriptional activator